MSMIIAHHAIIQINWHPIVTVLTAISILIATLNAKVMNTIIFFTISPSVSFVLSLPVPIHLTNAMIFVGLIRLLSLV